MKRKRVLIIGIVFAALAAAGYVWSRERGPSRSHLPPLLRAAANGNLRTVKRMLDANPAAIDFSDSNGNKAIHWAMLDSRKEVFYELIRRGYPIDDPRLLLCCRGTESGLEMLAYLLERGVNPNQLVGEGHTPLNLAVNNGPDEKIDLLLAHGASIDFRDARGRNAFDILDSRLAFINAPNSIWRIEANPSEEGIARARSRVEARKEKLLEALAKQKAAERKNEADFP